VFPEGSGALLAVAASEFGSTGSFALIDAQSLDSTTNIATLHHDTLLRADGSTLYAIAREGEDGDNIRRIDLANGATTVWQYSVGRGSNPWDLAVIGEGRGVVARYGQGDLVEVDLDADSPEAFVVGEPIVLDASMERDGRAEPSGLLVDDERVYVMVQGLDEYPWCTSSGRSRIVAFRRDTLALDEQWATDGTLVLRMCNVGTWAFDASGRLLIGFAGNSRVLGAELGRPAGEDDGGLELVDLAAGTSLGRVATEVDFGGRDLIDFAISSGDGGVWLVLADANFAVGVHRWNAVSGDSEAIGDAVWLADGVFDIEAFESRLWIADRTPGSEGVVILDDRDGSWIAGPVSTGHAPFDLEPIPEAHASP
jgi:hypothetical protein